MLSRFLRALLLLLLAAITSFGCRASCGGDTFDGPTMTLDERLGDYDFPALIETAPVPLHAGGEIGVRASDCASCHQDMHEEWSVTTHAAAMTDLQFIAELAKPDSPRWLCTTCHAPLQNQHRHILRWDSVLLGATDTELGTPEDVPNPHYDTALAAEGVTCASCHVRVHDDGRGTIIGARGDTDSPHRVTADPEALRNVCVRCHTPGEGHITPTFPCWFDTHGELADGPHSEKSCVDCHMPAATRPLAVGGTPRDTVHHFWSGGGVPKSFDGYDTLLDRGWKPGFSVSTHGPSLDGETARIRVDILNDQAGHALPTADPERHLRIHARLESTSGEVLSHESSRIGQQWHWGDSLRNDPARLISDNRISPGETRQLHFELHSSPMPDDARLTVEILHVRLSPENLAYARQTEIDEDLHRYRPDAGDRIAELERHYPSFSYAFSETRSLETMESTRQSLDELLENSRAARSWSLERLTNVVDGDEAR